MNETLSILLYDTSYVVLALVLLLVSKLALDFLTPFRVDDQMTSKDNPAFGVSLIGYYLGVIIVFISAFWGDSLTEISYLAELGIVTGWTLGGVVLLNVSRIILDKVVLHGFSTRKEIIEDQNTGMGVVEFGTYVGSALVVGGAISGTGGGIETALAFYLLGQAGLVLYAWLYQRLTSYDFHAEIEKDNTAAGLAYAGNIIAMGVLMMKGIGGDFLSWSEDLTDFAWYTIAGFVLLVLGRYAIDLVLLPKRTLHEEICEDGNVNAGYLEGALLIGLSAVIFFAM